MMVKSLNGVYQSQVSSSQTGLTLNNGNTAMTANADAISQAVEPVSTPSDISINITLSPKNIQPQVGSFPTDEFDAPLSPVLPRSFNLPIHNRYSPLARDLESFTRNIGPNMSMATFPNGLQHPLLLA